MAEMKDSEIRWIGQIPKNWKVIRVKDAFTRKKAKAKQENPVILSLARSGVKVRDITNNEGQLAENYSDYNPVMVDDLLLNPMDLISGDNCNISRVEGVISPAYVNLRYKNGINPEFYNFYFKYQYWCKAFFAYGKGVSFENRWTLNYDTLERFPLILPPIEEQNRIVKFLKGKCAEIDALHTDIEKQIETLEEYKKSIITEAVTKGLDPDVEMEDSGIEWIGMIPKEWECKKIKYVTNLSRGIFGHRPRNDPRYYDGKYPFIQTGDVACATKVITNYSQTLNELGKKVSKEFKKGTIALTIAANVGDVSILGFNAYFPDSIMAIIPHKEIDNMYFYYILSIMKSEFLRVAIINTQLNLNVERVGNLYIPITFDKNKQKEIVKYLDEKCAEIDGAIEEKKEQLDTLEQYKKSLIYEYVTGKKEVK